MAAIDSLKAQRDIIVSQIDEHRRVRARAQAQIAAINAAIDVLQAQKDDVVRAIRDLTDSWNPAP